MPGLPIAVEITPPDAPREHVAVLLAACGRASADAECVPAADVSVVGSRAVALVTWNGERRVVIEVGLRKDGRSEWRSRTLDFDRLDDPVERWRTIGFVVGTLSRPEATPIESSQATRAEVTADEPAKAPEPKSEPPPATPKRAPKPAPKKLAIEPATSVDAGASGDSRPSGPPPGGSLDIGGAFGSGLEGTRLGGVVRGRFRLVNVLGAVFAVRYLDRQIGDGGFGGRWLTGCVGVGVQLGSETIAFAVSADARGEYFQARAWNSQSRFLSGVGLGVNGGWMPTRTLGLFVGGDAAMMFGSTDVIVGEHSATDPPERFTVEAGVRVRLW